MGKAEVLCDNVMIHSDVVEKLKNIAAGYNITISEDEIRAIAQKEYDALKSADQV